MTLVPVVRATVVSMPWELRTLPVSQVQLHECFRVGWRKTPFFPAPYNFTQCLMTRINPLRNEHPLLLSRPF